MSSAEIAQFVAAIANILLVVGVGLTLWHNRKMVSQNNAQQLKIEIYREAVSKIDASLARSSAPSTTLQSFMSMLRIGIDRPNGMAPLIPRQRYPDFAAQHFDALRGITELTKWAERWEVIDPRLRIFRLAFSYSHHRMWQEFDRMRDLLMATMPVDRGDESEPYWLPPSVQQIDALTPLVKAYDSHSFDVLCWATDLQNELQTLLVGELFNRKVSRRDPPDPDVVVLRLDRVEELEAHFMSTDWGRGIIEAEVGAWAAFRREARV